MKKNSAASLLGATLLLQIALYCLQSAILWGTSLALQGSEALIYAYRSVGILTVCAVFVLPTVFYVKASGIGYRDLMHPVCPCPSDSRERKRVPFIFAAAITLNVANLAGMLTDALCGALGFSGGRSELSGDIGIQALAFASSVLLAPVLEELLFRGVALHALSQYGKRECVIVCGLLFALMHYELYPLFYAFCAGCSIAYFAVGANSLIYAIGLHAVNNGVAFLLTVADNYLEEEVVGGLSVAVLICSATLALVGIVHIAVTARRKGCDSRQAPDTDGIGTEGCDFEEKGAAGLFRGFSPAKPHTSCPNSPRQGAELAVYAVLALVMCFINTFGG